MFFLRENSDHFLFSQSTNNRAHLLLRSRPSPTTLALKTLRPIGARAPVSRRLASPSAAAPPPLHGVRRALRLHRDKGNSDGDGRGRR